MEKPTCISVARKASSDANLSRSSKTDRIDSRSKARVALLGAGLLTVATSFAAASASAEAADHYWAKVSATGTLLAGSGVSKVVQFGTGRYYIVTSKSISSCALIGTVNTVTEKSGYDPGPGSGSILVGEINSTEVFIRTATPSATAGSSATVDDNRPFSITLTCP